MADDDIEVVVGYPDEEKTNFSPSSFPSKIGGHPIFLLGEAARTPTCTLCNAVMRFVLQIYAPVDEPHAFHRTLYVYVCPHASCLRDAGRGAVCVLRAQLPRRNSLYPYDANGEMPIPRMLVTPQICAVCGGGALTRCAACGTVSYCGKACQKADWRMGHKTVCPIASVQGEQRADALKELELARRATLFREVALATEAASDVESGEESEDSDGSDDGEETEEQGNTTPIKGSMQDADAEELPEEIFKSKDTEDEVYERFKKVTRHPADQVVRYARGGTCLWMHSKGQRSDEDVKERCAECGGALRFEFQVLPQLLFYAEQGGGKGGNTAKRLRDGLDWGVVGVWTCSVSCAVGEQYVREVAWLQPAP